MESTACALCQTALPSHYMSEGDHSFCCAGCLAVYNVLSRRNELARYQESPLFHQALRSGLISNPALLQNLSRARDERGAAETQRLHLEITNLWCPSCAEVIRLVLQQEEGVINCVVDYFTDLAMIEFDLRRIGRDRVLQLIGELGYQLLPLENREARRVSSALWLRFIVAAFCAANLMMFSYPIYASYLTDDPLEYAKLFSWLSLLTALPVVTFSAWPLYQRVITSLPLGILGMEVLVVLGVLAAFVYSLWELFQGGIRIYFDSLSVVIAFVLLGKIIETRAKFSAKESLLRLTRAVPRRGRRREQDGTEAFVALKEVQAGDLMVALMGEKIVLDGVVMEGEGAVDESLMTGEALPVHKQCGEPVMTGTLLRYGRLVYRVTSSSDGSLLQQIIRMVERDLGQKSVTADRIIDRIAALFVPTVIAIAFLTGASIWLFGEAVAGRGLGETAFLRAIAVLLISCPCAIGIAVPLAESQLMHGLASLGAIVRNRACLAFLGRETAFVFDKTGTVTEGTFTVLEGVEDLSPEHQSALKGLASQSIHPVAVALAKAALAPAASFSSVEELTGRGLRGELNGRHYLLGSRSLLESCGISVANEREDGDSLASQVYFAKDSQLLSVIRLGDAIRPEAPTAIAELIHHRTCLVSGDARGPVEAVAKQCGFKDWHAGCSPLDKRAFVEALREKGEIVAMLGDGVNDALALTAAQVGISVVSATDVSIQVSDILLTTERLTVIPKLCALAQRARRIIAQNLFWAFAYNILGIGLAVTGQLSPIFAAFAMVTSSLIVIANSQRLRLN